MSSTPFIPPLNTPEGSPISSPPVIPSGGSPNMHPGQGWGTAPNSIPAGYAIFSPYHNPSPYIPSSPFVAPGVIPGQPHAQNNTRQGFSADWTGYPQGTPFSSPTHHLPGGYPSQNPMYGQPPHPTSPWYPTAPAGYPAFGGTPWPVPPQPFPPVSTPWGMQPGQLPPQAHAYTPWAPPGAIPPQATPWAPPGTIPPQANTPWAPPGTIPPAHASGGWNMPPSFFPPPQDPWMPSNGATNPQMSIPRGPPQPPTQILDRLDPFMEGDSYGPVLDSKLVRITGVQVGINPLLAPLPDDGSDGVHLRWNMLFPTSTIQRSTDPSHVSWSKGRDAPATFPRLKELRIVSETIPWIIHVKASKEDIGVTCAEVVEAIARDLNKNTGKAEFEALSPQTRNEVRAAYKHNRSPLPNVPGGLLGVGLKRLDFLRKNSIFGGIEFKDRVIRKVFSDLMPGVFVMECKQNMMTKAEIEDQRKRMAGEREPSRPPSSNGRNSRAGSSRSASITVKSPTETSSDEGEGGH